MSVRIIEVPAPKAGTPSGRLLVYSPDGETANIMLSTVLGVVAQGEGFRRPEIGPHTWWDAPDAEILATFGAFLQYALESEEDDAHEGWSILLDLATDWVVSLTAAGEEVM